MAHKSTSPQKKADAEKRILKPQSDTEEKVEKIQIIDSTLKKSKAPALRQKVELAMLSPLRYPINYDQLAANTARYTGAFFVIAGAFFTMVNFQVLDGHYATLDRQVADSQMANTLCTDLDTETCLSADTTIETVTETEDSSEDPCSDTSHPDYDTELCGPDEYIPDVDVVLDASDPQIGFADQDNGYSVVSGMIELLVHISDADKVEVSLQNETHNRTRIGIPTQIEGGIWKMSWDTTELDDGEYGLIVKVTQGSDVYEEDNRETVAIANHSSPTLYERTDTHVPEADHHVELSFDQEQPFHDRVKVSVRTGGAEKVTLFIDGNPVGEAKRNEDTWSYLLDTEKFEDGERRLYAKIYHESGEAFFSESSAILIMNTDREIISIDEIIETDSIFEPGVLLEVKGENPLNGETDVIIWVTDADFAELYAIPQYSRTPRFLGLARQVASDEWRFRMDTTQAPNGEYRIFTRIKNHFGLYDSEQVPITIQNEAEARTADEAEYIWQMEAVGNEINRPASTTDEVVERDPVIEADALQLSDESLFDGETLDAELQEATEEILDRFKKELKVHTEELARAIREDNSEDITQKKDALLDLRARIANEVTQLDLSADFIAKINRYIEEASETLEKLTERNEQLIKERIGDAALRDSDADSIADYDEINLYKTDPFSADSDNDGFTDGAEILGGFDPTDSSAEALVVYESPEEQGVTREDILSVDMIETVEAEPEGTAEEHPKAIIRGKGLPNSFVTLYIFSTPIIVTVRTEDDGSWSYTFDKELENGEHEVYVGITDNAGRIVAKSNPLQFVKTAEAFSIAEAATAAAPAPEEAGEPSFTSNTSLLIIASLCVVGLGLVLILLGMHVRMRRLGADPNTET